MIKYRPHRGLLSEAMSEMKTFGTIDEMKSYIISQWDYFPERGPCFGPVDIVIRELYMDDDRIGWKNVCHVCVKRLWNEIYESPQCIGMCCEDHDSCKMIEDGNEIFCSECKIRMKDEIYYMFQLNDDFQYCPHCGRKIIKE